MKHWIDGALHHSPALHESSPMRSPVRIGGAIALAVALAGCTHARATNVASSYAASPPPSEILVSVAAYPSASANAEDSQVAAKVAANLQTDLVREFAEAGITAEPYGPGTIHPGAVVLRATITDADPGNAIRRFVIGFGAGKARLEVAADLENGDAGDARTMTSFDTSSDTGHKPGMIMPAGIALATRNYIHLAIGGGLKVATSFNDGLGKPTDDTAKAIVAQVKQYYTSIGSSVRRY